MFGLGKCSLDIVRVIMIDKVTQLPVQITRQIRKWYASHVVKLSKRAAFLFVRKLSTTILTRS